MKGANIQVACLKQTILERKHTKVVINHGKCHHEAYEGRPELNGSLIQINRLQFKM